MSASNLAKCPRCARRTAAVLDRREAEVSAMYGQVPIADFDAARRQLANSRDALESLPPTFAEYYEVYGAQTGTVKVSYGGACSECGLRLDFEVEREIPDVEAP